MHHTEEKIGGSKKKKRIRNKKFENEELLRNGT